MAENMIPGFQGGNSGSKVRTAMGDRAVLVQYTSRGSVSYQDSDTRRDHIPFFLERFSPLQDNGITGTGIKQRMPGGGMVTPSMTTDSSRRYTASDRSVPALCGFRASM